MVALLSSSAAPPRVRLRLANLRHPPTPNPNLRVRRRPVGSRLCEREAPALDWSSLAVRESTAEAELLAAVRLRVRTFYGFKPSYAIEEYRKQLIEREFEALKDRVSGKRKEFIRVSCINAMMSPPLAPEDEWCSACKFTENGQEQVVVGTLDLNQCLWLMDELPGKKPEGTGDEVTRAYLSNVCVAKELQRNGLAYAVITKSKKVARQWGITDLYVHVAVDNEAAQKLYRKSGFIYESEEPAWRARFLDRPRRYLLWTDLTKFNL